MGYSREKWHSGLTYRRTCDQCKITFEYDDHKLDFRPWFADGFVYCPRCEKPLRHNENYAIKVDDAKQEVIDATNQTSILQFCRKCGYKIPYDSKFCPECGEKVVDLKNKICGNCGKELDAESKFCSECGTKVE